MGIFDPSYKRLAIILFCFVFLTIMYTFQFVFLVTAEEPEIMLEKKANVDIDEHNISGVQSESQSIGGDLFSIIKFITYTSPAIPAWMMLFLAPIVTITLIVSLYLVLDIIYDIVKALPFT